MDSNKNKVPAVEETKKQEPVIREPEKEIKYGVVTDCIKLNVRKSPTTKEENVVCTINALSEVEIDVTASKGGFYKVTTEDGIEGFCMKRYITIKP